MLKLCARGSSRGTHPGAAKQSKPTSCRTRHPTSQPSQKLLGAECAPAPRSVPSTRKAPHPTEQLSHILNYIGENLRVRMRVAILPSPTPHGLALLSGLSSQTPTLRRRLLGVELPKEPLHHSHQGRQDNRM